MISLFNTRAGFGLLSILLHWSMAAVVFGLFVLGLYMTGLDYMDPWYRSAPRLHKGFGLILFFLLVVRTASTLSQRAPEPVIMPGWERRAASAVQKLFYFLLYGVTMSGYLISTADGRGVEFFALFEVPAVVSGIERQEDIAGAVHLALASTTVALACLHALAALKHHFVDRDPTLLRMLGRGTGRFK